MFVAWYLAFALPVALQASFASADLFLTVDQMRARGIEKGLPFLYHGAMWADVFLLAPLMAYVITNHSAEWSWEIIGYAFIAGLLASGIMHFFVYVPSGAKFPEAHVHNDLLTNAGWIHLVYFAWILTVSGLFYVATKNVPAEEVAIVSGLLFVHTFIGTHVPLKIWAKFAEPSWYPVDYVIDLPTAVTLFGVAIVLAALTLWRIVIG